MKPKHTTPPFGYNQPCPAVGWLSPGTGREETDLEMNFTLLTPLRAEDAE